jgi:hypothetical protein
VPVHDVEVQQVRAAALDLANVLGEMSEVG